MKVLFDTRKVQKMGRIALGDQLLRNAGLSEGDPVNIYFDAATKRIIVERAEPKPPSAVVPAPTKARAGGRSR